MPLPGQIAIAVNFLQLATGDLGIEIDEVVAAVDFDRVNVTGAVSLGGDLNVAVGFSAQAGNEFIIISPVPHETRRCPGGISLTRPREILC